MPCSCIFRHDSRLQDEAIDLKDMYFKKRYDVLISTSGTTPLKNSHISIKQKPFEMKQKIFFIGNDVMDAMENVSQTKNNWKYMNHNI